MNNTSSIEFQTIKDELQQSDAVRKAFRVPVESRDDIKVVLNDETYLVVDISISGVSIVSKENPTLVVSKTYQNCQLKTPDGTIDKLTGKIIHFTSGSADTLRNGIKWVELDPSASRDIESLVSKLKAQVLQPKTDDPDSQD